jgi:dihydroorotate dehydrogenase
MLNQLEKCLDLGSFALRLLPPEFAHHLAMKALKQKWLIEKFTPLHIEGRGLMLRVPGIGEIAHPIGLAAGFDKDATSLMGLQSLGFSFIEVGTVTPQPQNGQKKPRIFRLKDQHSLINRMGFPSQGARSMLVRLQGTSLRVPLGINVGKNAQTPNQHAITDYLNLIRSFENRCQYLVVNLSSPNTPGLRELASVEFLKQLQLEIEPTTLAKVWIKLSPDMAPKDLRSIVTAINEFGFQGIVLTNTHSVDYPHRGGLSGPAMAQLALENLQIVHDVNQRRLPVISVGGISNGLDVLLRLKHGASCVQIYTALVYRGPFVIHKILKELMVEMQQRGIESLEEYVLHGT